MKPMEAAAADSPRVKVGSTQKGGGKAYIAAAVSESQARTAVGPRPGRALRLKAAAATTMGTNAWSFRSPVRSEDHPEATIARRAAANGTAASAAEAESESPETSWI